MSDHVSPTIDSADGGGKCEPVKYHPKWGQGERVCGDPRAGVEVEPVDDGEVGRIVRWIDQAIEKAKRHGNTEGIWLFASQWITVRAALRAIAARTS